MPRYISRYSSLLYTMRFHVIALYVDGVVQCHLQRAAGEAPEFWQSLIHI